MKNVLRLLGSKTVIGATGAVLTWLTTLPVIDAKHVIGGASVLLGVAGVRDALHKVVDAITVSTSSS